MPDNILSDTTTTFKQPTEWNKKSISELWELREQLTREFAEADQQLDAMQNQLTEMQESFYGLCAELDGLEAYMLERKPTNEKEAMPLIFLAKHLICNGDFDLNKKISEILGSINFKAEAV